ncbi:sugar phosphate nucleotidyltransferase [Candidatus Marinimicrobia bacterium]|nr:sugar phosphate nucleotidyltransferase [Candidatus Neomarinimicrobiota bacterium]
MSSKLHIGILAAGKGSRMESTLPKVLHKLNGKSLIDYVLETASELKPQSTTLVVGFEKDLVKSHTKNYKVNYVSQDNQLGTGHAVLQMQNVLENQKGHLLILSGDVPNIKSASLFPIIRHHIKNNHSATVLTAIVSDSTGYGRIIRNINGDLLKIVEEKDCNNEQRNIKEINSGIFIFKISELFPQLKNIKSNNAQKEYYLTDVMELIGEKMSIHASIIGDSSEVLGINTVNQLSDLENKN